MPQSGSERTRFVDLSHAITNGMAVSPGLPTPRIEPFISHAASRAKYAGMAEFEITRLFLVGNTGTSIDSPYHRYPERADIAGLPLGALAGLPGVCLAATRRGGRGGRAVTAPPDRGSLAGCAVLIKTGWDGRWGSGDYWTDGPFLDPDFLESLVSARPALVGVDFANVDDPRDLSRPAHSRLLGADVPILEHLRALDALPQRGFRLFAVPVAVQGAAAMPVRVFAELPEHLGASGTF